MKSRIGTIRTTLLVVCTGTILVACAVNEACSQPDQGSKYFQEAIHLKNEHKFRDALEKLYLASCYFQENDSIRQSILCELEIARINRIKGEFDSVIVALGRAETLNNKPWSHNEELSGTINYEYGVVYLEIGEIEKGKEHILKALDIYKAQYGEQDSMLAPVYNKLGNYYFFKKEFYAALDLYSKALNLANNAMVSESSLASYIQNLGITHVELGDYQKAEYYFKKMINQLSIRPPADITIIIKAYANLGKFYYDLSLFNIALTYLDQVENLLNKDFERNYSGISHVYWNKGIIYLMQGEYDKAIQLLIEARRLIEAQYSKNSPYIPSINMDLALAYEAMGNDNKALEYYYLSLENAPAPLQIKVYRNLAKYFMFKDNIVQARHYIGLCLKITRESEFNNKYEQANTLMRYGQILDYDNDPGALHQYEAALELLKETFGPKHRDVAMVNSFIGNYYTRKSQADSALIYYHKSIIAITLPFDDKQLLKNPNAGDLPIDLLTISFLSSKAKTLEKLYETSGNLDYIISAIDCYELSFHSLEKFTLSYRAEESKEILTDYYHNNYHNAIKLNLLAYDQNQNIQHLHKAFMISEKSKAANLLAELRDENARNIGMVPGNLLELEKTIRENLYMYKTNMYKAENGLISDQNKIEYLRSALFKWEKRYDSLIRIYISNYPEYYRLKFDPSVITVKEAKRILSSDDVIIEYSLSDDQLVTFLISPEHFKVFRTSIDSSLIRDVFLLRENLNIMEIQKYTYQDFIRYQETANKLYRILIEPVNEYIKGKHLIIIPDGGLAYLSFESLLKGITPSDTIAFRRLPYLITENSISYVSSSTIFSIAIREKKPVLKNGILAMAPTYTIDTRGMPEIEAVLAEYPMRRKNLPGALKEAEIILKIMKGIKLIGEDATEANFKKYAKNYDILHFAMHAKINDENPLSSKLSFFPSLDSTEDNVLHTYEIYNMKLKGHLAVLSACSSGSGKLQKGEGVISLARAFAFAGMPSILMTLWDVEDHTSGFIIPFFYQFLSIGYSKDEALRHAKLKYLQNARMEIETHPAFWSGFVIYGSPEGFRQRKEQSLIIAIAGLCIMLLSILYFITRKYLTYKNRIKIHPD